MILSEHLVRCDTDGIDFKTHWYQWTVGRLQQIFMMVISMSFNNDNTELLQFVLLTVILSYLHLFWLAFLEVCNYTLGQLFL